MQIICTLAGAQFRPAESKAMMETVTIGDVLALEPDGDNEYDPQAVKVMLGSHHIGFIPKQSNGPIFNHLINGDLLFATIVAFEGPLKPVLEINL
jgi:hypothetical protein